MIKLQITNLKSRNRDGTSVSISNSTGQALKIDMTGLEKEIFLGFNFQNEPYYFQLGDVEVEHAFNSSVNEQRWSAMRMKVTVSPSDGIINFEKEVLFSRSQEFTLLQNLEFGIQVEYTYDPDKVQRPYSLRIEGQDEHNTF